MKASSVENGHVYFPEEAKMIAGIKYRRQGEEYEDVDCERDEKMGQWNAN